VNLDFHVSRFDWAGATSDIGPNIVTLAQLAEVAGVRTLSFMDHYFQMETLGAPEDPMLEGYATLSYVAGVTSALRLRLLVTSVTYRHPGLLAKIVSTLDVLSGGRAELGIGAGWYEREHKGLGVPFPSLTERFERLEETLQICLQMWSGESSPYAGRYYQLAETLCRPLPLTLPHPRILIGGMGERKTLRLVAQYADACNLHGDPEAVSMKLDVLRDHCDALGRDVNEIEVTALLRELPPSPSADDILQRAEALAAVGVSTVVAGTHGVHPLTSLEGTFGPIVDRLADIEPRPLDA
jgi:F420-dependent oxidoreductase-like protein